MPFRGLHQSLYYAIDQSPSVDLSMHHTGIPGAEDEPSL